MKAQITLSCLLVSFMASSAFAMVAGPISGGGPIQRLVDGEAMVSVSNESTEQEACDAAMAIALRRGKETCEADGRFRGNGGWLTRSEMVEATLNPATPIKLCFAQAQVPCDPINGYPNPHR